MDKDNTSLTPKADSQSRKYQLTINNPLDVELPDPENADSMIKVPFDHAEIKRRLGQLKSIVYWCMADEIGLETQTPHTHIYIRGHSNIRFSTIKNKFPTAHIESAYGSSQCNRDYIKKEGKWKETSKKETSVEGTFEEWGEIPMTERMTSGGMDEAIYNMVENGFSDEDILKLFPGAFHFLDKIQRLRQTLVESGVRDLWRELEITYVFGETETGKTRTIMEQYGYSNVHRVTDYSHPWDGYRHSQDVVLFEEFRSSLPISDMLVYLEGYPCTLKARYANKQACFTKIFITSNIPLEAQYRNVQLEEPITWRAFIRRIKKIKHYQSADTIITYNSPDEYFRARPYSPQAQISDKDFAAIFPNLKEVPEERTDKS